MNNVMDISKKVAENLLKREAVVIKIDPPFTWTSGIKAPVYCDNRLMLSYPEERKLVVDGFIGLIKEKGLNPDVIGGTATAAIPWAAFVAEEMNLPMIYIRKESKGYGADKRIEGHVEPGQNVLIIEDLISTAGSSVSAAQAVREEGKCTVDDIFAITTYEFQKAKDRFEEANIKLSVLTDFTQILNSAVERGDIEQDQLDTVLKFREDPPSWWDSFNQ